MSSSQHEYQEHLKQVEREELVKNAELILGFSEYATGLGCQFTDSSFAYANLTGVTANIPGIVRHLCPELAADKDGLYSLSTLQALHQPSTALSPLGLGGGYVQTDKFILFAHPFFRRNYYKSNNWAPSFIDLFWRLRDPEIDALIALDLDRVRIDPGSAYFERDMWQGVAFRQDIAAIPDGIAQLRPSLDFDEDDLKLLFHGVYSLDIEWRTADGIKSFYAEEFRDENTMVEYAGVDYYPTRYIHAEFDLAGGYFRHFDGALHLYDIEDYMNRRTSDFNYNRKNRTQIKAKSLKLFRLDGRVSVETWMELVTNFFSHDPLIIEYFTGRYPDHLERIRQRLRS